MFQIAWVLVTILLCVCSYYLGSINTWRKANQHVVRLAAQLRLLVYLGSINTWRKANQHVVRLAAQHGVHLTDGGLGDFEGDSNTAIGK